MFTTQKAENRIVRFGGRNLKVKWSYALLACAFLMLAGASTVLAETTKVNAGSDLFRIAEEGSAALVSSEGDAGMAALGYKVDCVGAYRNGTAIEQAALSFDLEGITETVNSAKLKIYIVDKQGKPSIEVFPADNSIGAGFPAISGYALANCSNEGIPASGWMEMDVTDYVRGQSAAGADACFILGGSTSGYNDVSFVATVDAAADKRPVLEIVPAGSNRLGGIVLSGTVLNEAFNAGTANYTANVGYDLDSITVTPTAEDATAGITVNGVAVGNGQASEAINLITGTNTPIAITVTSADGLSTHTYSITIIKAVGPYLTGITLSQGSLAEAFSKTTYAHNANIPYDGETVMVTPMAEDPNASITINGAAVASGTASAPITMDVGQNLPITIVVTTANGTDSQTYTITPTRASSPYLANVLGIPREPFNKQVYLYSGSTPNASIRITPTSEDSEANITVNTTQVTSGQFIKVTLSAGNNTITIVVTSKTGVDQKTYTFNVLKT